MCVLNAQSKTPIHPRMRSIQESRVARQQSEQSVDRRRRRRRHPVVLLRQIDDRRPLHRRRNDARSIARAKHVTEVNDITCNYDRLISGRGALTRSSETEVTLEPPAVMLRNSALMPKDVRSDSET